MYHFGLRRSRGILFIYFRHGNSHTSTILIGNKVDLVDKRTVSEDEALSFARKHKLDYIESSAFNSQNISLVFETIVKKIVR